jgi:hypothetical protein
MPSGADPTRTLTLMRRRVGKSVLTLFVAAVLTGSTAAALTGVALAEGAGLRSEECCPAGGPPAQPTAWPDPEPDPTATPEPGPTRDGPLPTCLIGSWRVTFERFPVEFYTDAAPITFRSNGRRYEFRPDGTGTVRFDRVVATGSHQGTALRMEWDGEQEFTWSADDTAITYHAFTEATGTVTAFENSQQTSSGPLETVPDFNEVDQYECRGDQLDERNPDRGYEARWARTGDYGVYG